MKWNTVAAADDVCYELAMKENLTRAALVVAVDDAKARMAEYALTPESRLRLSVAEAEIAAGLGIVVDDEYFSGFRARRKQARRAAR